MQALIKKAKSRDAEAFIQLMDMHMQQMYKTARAILSSDADAADAVQETILTCWEKIKDLKQDRYFKTWLIRILVNKCRDQLRFRERVVPSEDTGEESIHCPEYDTAEWKAVLDSLDEKYRLVMLFYYIDGLKTSEIAQILEMPESTVRTRLERGRKQLASDYLDGQSVGSDGSKIRKAGRSTAIPTVTLASRKSSTR